MNEQLYREHLIAIESHNTPGFLCKFMNEAEQETDDEKRIEFLNKSYPPGYYNALTFIACCPNHQVAIKCAKQLIELGAHPNIPDSRGRKAHIIALQFENRELHDMLKGYIDEHDPFKKIDRERLGR